MDDRAGLLLSRKAGQTVKIGPGIVVEVKNIKGNRVALRFVAPPALEILRGELRPRVNLASGRDGTVHG